MGIQLAFDLPQNDLQNKYLQARELIIRFINDDPNVSKDAMAWIERTNVTHAENKHHAGMHIGEVHSSNIKRISFYENDEYQLVVEFHRGGKYAYALPDGVEYILLDGTSRTLSPNEIFDYLARENECKKNGNPGSSVSGLFDALVKRTDNKTEPVRYKRI